MAIGIARHLVSVVIEEWSVVSNQLSVGSLCFVLCFLSVRRHMLVEDYPGEKKTKYKVQSTKYKKNKLTSDF